MVRTNKKGKQEPTESINSESLVLIFTNITERYKLSNMCWSIAFLGFLLFIIFVLLCILLGSGPLLNIRNWYTALLYSMTSIVFAGFCVWLGVFLANRRAESKKLEETYRHKEAMVKFFIEYEEIVKVPSGDNTYLFQNYMTDPLKAIAKDPSNFLTTKGDSHLIEALLKKRKNKNSN